MSRELLEPHESSPSQALRDLANEYDADLVTYGGVMALDALVSDLTEALDRFAEEASRV